MAHRVIYEAFGQRHDDIWLGGSPEKIQAAIIDICPTAKIHTIEPTLNDLQNENNRTTLAEQYAGMDILRAE